MAKYKLNLADYVTKSQMSKIVCDLCIENDYQIVSLPANFHVKNKKNWGIKIVKLNVIIRLETIFNIQRSINEINEVVANGNEEKQLKIPLIEKVFY